MNSVTDISFGGEICCTDQLREREIKIWLVQCSRKRTLQAHMCKSMVSLRLRSMPRTSKPAKHAYLESLDRSLAIWKLCAFPFFLFHSRGWRRSPAADEGVPLASLWRGLGEGPFAEYGEGQPCLALVGTRWRMASD